MNDLRGIFKNLSPFKQTGESTYEPGMPNWRERIFDSMLATVLVWGLIALIPSVGLSFATGLWGIGAVDLIAYLLAFILFVIRKKIPYTLRAFFFITVGLFLGIIVFVATGNEGAGLFWIFAIPPFASLLLGLRWGLVFSGVNILFLTATGLVIASGFGSTGRVNEFSVVSWVVYSVNFLAANAIVTVPLGTLIEGLLQSSDRQKKRLAQLEAIRDLSIGLRSTLRLDEMMPLLLATILSVTNGDAGGIWLYDKPSDELRLVTSRGMVDAQGKPIVVPPEKPGQGLVGVVFSQGQIHSSRDYHSDLTIPEYIRQRVLPGLGWVSVPIKSEDETIGVLLVSTILPKEAAGIDVDVLTTLAEMAGSAIRRASLHQQTERQLEQFKVLNEIDQIILSSFDLQFNLKMLLGMVVEQLQVDAANILLYDAVTQTLTALQGVGFRTASFAGRQVHLGEGNAGRAVSERKAIHIEHLEKQTDNPRLARALSGEGFVSYYGVPLIAKGDVRGVLELFHRTPLVFQEDWLSLVNALAGRAAIAIDTLKVFENLDRTNKELVHSYDATIEGWSQALDLRDKETEGHTQRVTALAVELARALGVHGKPIVHFSRGALLHDIGKMGIPDSILLKPGKLTDEEWVIMRKHPTYARDMLENISFLQEAVDIPYGHHEKWDGSGYPRGLVGEQIPLAARIFAVVDVYDALTSDRPYRRAWTKKKTLAYIREQSGSHFDPRIVEAFFKLDLPK